MDSRLASPRLRFDVAGAADRWQLAELLLARDTQRGLYGCTVDMPYDPAQRLLAASAGPVPLAWMIRMRDHAETLGCATLVGLDPDPHAIARIDDVPAPCELGLALFPDVWSQGYALEAARAVLNFAFGTLGQHRVEGSCHATNERAQVLMQRLGFMHVGGRVDHGSHRFAYLLLARDFRAALTASAAT